MARTRVFVEQTGRVIEPFRDAIGETPILNRPLMAWQAKAFADADLAVTTTLEPPSLVVPDTLFASGGALRAFVEGAAGLDAVLVLKRSEFATMTTPVQPLVSEVEEGFLFEAIRFVSGHGAEPRRVVVDPRERVIETRVPSQYVRQPELSIGLPRDPVITLHHWVHILWANLLAGRYETQAAPMRKLAPRIAWAVARRRSLNKWNVLRGLSNRGTGCDVHPTAVIEGSTLGNDVTVGPYARVLLSHVGDGATIMAGAQVEFSVLGERSRATQQAVLRFSVLYPEAIASGLTQQSVFGRQAMITGSNLIDLNLERAARVELDGELYSTGQQFLGSAIGHRVRIGAGVALASGRAIPNDYVIVLDPDQGVSTVPPGLADAGPLRPYKRGLRPLADLGGDALPSDPAGG